MRLVAVIALLAAAAGCGGDAERVLVDERSGELRGVRFGESDVRVRAKLGEPAEGEGFFPTDAESFTGPPAIPALDGRPAVLRYDDVAFLVSPTSGVYSMTTVADGAETRAGLGVGDDLARVREAHRVVTCGKAAAGEAILGGEDPTYPWCTATVGEVRVHFGGDPIASVTLTTLKP